MHIYEWRTYMKISELLKNDKPSISFEVFPPKQNSNYESVKKAAMDVAALKPNFVSVTYGAGGGTSEYTINIASDIQKNYGVTSMAHLTCISSDRATVSAQLEKIKAAGIENIMALRGDIPEDMKGCDLSTLDYTHAADMIREIRSKGYDFCLGGACYPECHPDSANQKEDLQALKEKVDAGVDFLTTQMIFDNDLFFNFMYKLRNSGVFVPVVPGIMPITNAKQLARIKTLSGAYMPRKFVNLCDRFGDDKQSMVQAGIAYATEQIIDLFANGINNVHIYTMNNPQVAAKIQENLSSIIG